MPEWSFQRKLISGVILICLLAMVTSAGALFASRVLVANMSQSEVGAGRDLADARAIQFAGIRNIAAARACLLTGEPRLARATLAGSLLVRDQAGSLRTRVPMASGKNATARNGASVSSAAIRLAGVNIYGTSIVLLTADPQRPAKP